MRPHSTQECGSAVWLLARTSASAAQLIALDEARRKIVTRLQEAQARRNAASKEVGKAKAAKDEAAAGKLMAEVAALKDELVRVRRSSASPMRICSRPWR